MASFRCHVATNSTQDEIALDIFVGRTYLSSLERGMKAPTITKVNEIASVIGVHPLSLAAYAYIPANPTDCRARFV
ncbi:helix-turn-helix domain-containing protein [Massilia sp. GCM10023247]|uniref:helix-turn-helix domain-containing protein n=1 Tax=Massilia sp. GCM10023247 TaxID=3252643 RepID=UPI003611265E